MATTVRTNNTMDNDNMDNKKESVSSLSSSSPEPHRVSLYEKPRASSPGESSVNSQSSHKNKSSPPSPASAVATTTVSPPPASKTISTTSLSSANGRTSTNTTTDDHTRRNKLESFFVSRTSNSQQQPKKKEPTPFPVKLHQLLCLCDETIIRWQPDNGGKSFTILNCDAFETDVLPRLYRNADIESFGQLLSLYGFQRVDDGPCEGDYYHPLFIQDKPHLARTMRKHTAQGAAASSKTNESSMMMAAPGPYSRFGPMQSSVASRLMGLSFPGRLHYMLCHGVFDLGLDHIMCWQPGGTSFAITCLEDFETQGLADMLGTPGYASFRGQLFLHGFQRVRATVEAEGPDHVEAFLHRDFVRDRPQLCHRIRSSRQLPSNAAAAMMRRNTSTGAPPAGAPSPGNAMRRRIVSPLSEMATMKSPVPRLPESLYLNPRAAAAARMNQQQRHAAALHAQARCGLHLSRATGNGGHHHHHQYMMHSHEHLHHSDGSNVYDLSESDTESTSNSPPDSNATKATPKPVTPTAVASAMSAAKRTNSTSTLSANKKSDNDDKAPETPKRVIKPRKRARVGTMMTQNYFPFKLHSLLTLAEKFGYQHIMTWAAHGRCFIVHDKDLFCTAVLPLFRHSEFASFRAQLKAYGFVRINRSGPDKGAYYHTCFLRGRPELCATITRRPKNVNGTVRGRPKGKHEVEPNFYKMKFLPDLNVQQVAPPPGPIKDVLEAALTQITPPAVVTREVTDKKTVKSLLKSMPLSEVKPHSNPVPENQLLPKSTANDYRTLPMKLHALLNDAHDHDFNYIVSWNDCGRSFTIKDESIFEDVLVERWLGMKNLKAFQEELELYGFKRRKDEKGSYYHEMFHKALPHLCRCIKRCSGAPTSAIEAVKSASHLPNSKSKAALEDGDRRLSDLTPATTGSSLSDRTASPELEVAMALTNFKESPRNERVLKTTSDSKELPSTVTPVAGKDMLLSPTSDFLAKRLPSAVAVPNNSATNNSAPSKGKVEGIVVSPAAASTPFSASPTSESPSPESITTPTTPETPINKQARTVSQDPPGRYDLEEMVVEASSDDDEPELARRDSADEHDESEDISVNNKADEEASSSEETESMDVEEEVEEERASPTEAEQPAKEEEDKQVPAALEQPAKGEENKQVQEMTTPEAQKDKEKMEISISTVVVPRPVIV